MSIDMSQFHAVFLEESQEHLDEMEQLLMTVNLADPDPEDLNSIFRAAHSIKGGSGIFGFDALISVTHAMENLFEKTRQRVFHLDRSSVDMLLEAIDALRHLLKNYQEKNEPDWALVQHMTEKVESLLTQQSNPLKANDEEGFGFFDFPTELQTDEDDGFGFFTEDWLQNSEQPLPESPSDPREQIEQREQADSTSSTKNHSAAPSPVSSQNDRLDKSSTPRPANETASKVKAESFETSSIRVETAKIDNLVNLMGELVITQSMLNLIGSSIQSEESERLQATLLELERNTRDLQDNIMSIRMLPVSFVFNRFPRMVRDMATKLHKKVDLWVEGGQTEIDKGIIERLVDPLTHLVRNCLDHGLELPEERLRKGKSEAGSLILKAQQKGGNILISVQDDGAGLHRSRLLQKAAEKGLSLPDNPTDQQVWDLIMMPGFSTAEEITDISGRGVGMDVVHNNIENLGGQLEIHSTPDQGTCFQIRLPLTLAILEGLQIAVADQAYIIPLVNIIESIQPNAAQIKSVGNQKMLDLRETYWPVISLHELFDIDGAQHDMTQAILVLVESSKTRYALLVDDIVGQQQVVIKSLEQHYRRVTGIAGATILGDGEVALILDAESLALHIEESTVI